MSLHKTLLTTTTLFAVLATTLPVTTLKSPPFDPTKPFNLKATPEDPTSAISRQTVSLCILPTITSSPMYLGSMCGTDHIYDAPTHSPITLHKNALTGTHRDESTAIQRGRNHLYASKSLSPKSVTLAGEFVTFAGEELPGDVQGDIGFFSTDQGNVLYVVDAEGEKANWWLCPSPAFEGAPEGSRGRVLNYGFHKSFGDASENKGCVPTILKGESVERTSG